MTSNQSRPTRYTRTAEGITNELLRTAVTYGEDCLGWTSLKSTGDAESELRTGHSLYEGQLGIALYLAVYADLKDDKAAARGAARAASPWVNAEPTVHTVRDNGAMVGLGSIIYALFRIGMHLSEEPYIKQALEIARSVSMDRIESDTVHDVNLGNAGLLLALTNLLEYENDDTVRRLGRDVTEHIIDLQVASEPEHAAWETVREQPTTGFAHGTAGIAYALARWHSLTGNQRARQTATRAIRFEDKHYSWGASNSTPSTEEGISWEAWCWGRPGICLSRAAIGRVLTNPPGDIDKMVDEYASVFDSELKAEDSLCHGTFGDVAMLTTLGKILDPKFRSDANKLAELALDRFEREGHFRLPNEQHASFARPSLFLGKAGIGYSILRLIDPDSVPSVLLLDS